MGKEERERRVEGCWKRVHWAVVVCPSNAHPQHWALWTHPNPSDLSVKLSSWSVHP